MAYILPKSMIPKSVLAFWKRNRLWIILGFFVLAVILGIVFRTSSKGTWDTSYYYKPEAKKKTWQNNSFNPDLPKRRSKGEIECQQSLQRMFRKPFETARPDFLGNNVTGFNLEIDCWDPELKLGVEYQGIQHYKFKPYFHKTFSDFRNQQYRDEMKRMKCKDAGVILIEVPHTVKESDIETFLRKECKKKGIKVPY